MLLNDSNQLEEVVRAFRFCYHFELYDAFKSLQPISINVVLSVCLLLSIFCNICSVSISVSVIYQFNQFVNASTE